MRDSLPMTALRASGLLELQPCADQDTVRQAYLDLVRVWHPDRFGDDERLREKANAKLAELNAAYAVLKQTPPAFQFLHTVPVQATNQPMRTRRRVRVQVVRRRPAAAARFVVSAVAAAAAVLTLIAVLLTGFDANPAEGAVTRPQTPAAAPSSSAAVAPSHRAPVVTAALAASAARPKSPFSRDLDRVLARSRSGDVSVRTAAALDAPAE